MRHLSAQSSVLAAAGRHARRLAVAGLLVFAAGSRVLPQSAPHDVLEQGFQALQQRDADKAGAIFRTVLAQYPRDTQALLGAAVVAQMQGRDQDAIAHLKHALEVDPQLIQAAAMLGEVAYRQGDIDLAIKMYERILPSVPPSAAPAVRQRLDAWRSEAALPQSRAAFKDDRFSISFDGPAQQKLAARAAAVLTAAFWRIGKTLGAYPSAPINVILYTERQFHDITGAPEWSGGGFDGQIRMPVRGASQNLEEFDRVLAHELTHAMLHTIAPRNVPAWLHEGLAMYGEGKDAALSERRLAQLRLFVPLQALEGSFARLNTAQAVVAYEESAFATRALLDRIGPSGLNLLLQDLAAGQTLERAIEQFGVTFAAFQSDLERRVGVRRPPASR